MFICHAPQDNRKLNKNTKNYIKDPKTHIKDTKSRPHNDSKIPNEIQYINILDSTASDFNQNKDIKSFSINSRFLNQTNIDIFSTGQNIEILPKKSKNLKLENKQF